MYLNMLMPEIFCFNITRLLIKTLPRSKPMDVTGALERAAVAANVDKMELKLFTT